MTNAVTIYEGKERSLEEQLDHIYGQVACGRSLYSVIHQDDGLMSHAHFWKLHMARDDIKDNLARARENGVDALLEKAQHVAENPIEETELMEEIGPNGVKTRRTIKEALGHRRLVIDTYVKRAQMVAPRKYGVKNVDVTSGGDSIGVRTSEQLDDVTRAVRLAAIFAGVQKRIEAEGEG